MGYAGRLDPMAEGVLLILVGDELKNQKEYWALDKEYEAKILLGAETDTYDILGLPKIPNPKSQITNKFQSPKSKIQKTLESFQGEYTFDYPPYASRKVKGKPLFWWARRGKLSEIKIPTKTVQIHEIELLDVQSVAKEKLQNRILKNISLVMGNFRQKQIKAAWKKVFKQARAEKFVIIKIRVFASSGTYIRTIAHELGKKLGTGAALLHLKRTKVGNFKVKNSIHVK